jgi:hypothetical protein
VTRLRAGLLLAGALLLALAALAIALGRGAFGEHEGPGSIVGDALPSEVVDARLHTQQAAYANLLAPRARERQADGAARALEVYGAEQAGNVPLGELEKSILFGDLHVHTSVSMDAYLMSLPLAGGEGAHPAADACDYARYCSALDFWSLNDHAESIAPDTWRESVESIRQCNDVAGDPNNPDLISYLGWEWTQVGATPEQHYGHRNVILRDLADDAIPARPIAAAGSRVGALARSLPARAAFVASNLGDARVHGFARHVSELQDAELCPADVPTRDLPRDCRESAATPNELFAKLRDWGSAALVIPHGTAWGFTASPLASWETQLGDGVHDDGLQRLIEVHSGHGNSEEYRTWRPVSRDASGAPVCPPPSADYMPTCWRAGEIIETRCLAQGESAAECAARADDARTQAAQVASRASESVVPLASGEEWGDSGQCRDCFLPAFQLRPLLSVQYLLALTSFTNPNQPWRYKLGFIAASDVHSARPGTGYKEFGRDIHVDGAAGRARSRAWDASATRPARALRASEARDGGVAALLRGGPPDDRIGSLLFTGGLTAVHTPSRDRAAIWDALARREVYGTSGQRTLLWFDLVNAQDGATRPMGSELRLSFAPRFRVRAIGSQKQEPGCPNYAASGLPAEKLARLCRGECFNPSDERHSITRIEVVRIRPQREPGEPVDGLIEDPWRSFACEPNAAGCTVEFADDEFSMRARDAIYYVRAIEEPTPAVNGAGFATTLGDPGDDRLGNVEERAWSSPIYVDYGSDEASAPGAEAASAPGSAAPTEATPPAPPAEGELDPAWSEPPAEL